MNSCNFFVILQVPFFFENVEEQDLLKTYGDIDSKFKFVLLSSKRAKQLLKGAKPKLKSKSKSLIRIAQQEVRKGLLDYEIVQRKKGEEFRPEDEDFIGEEIEVENDVTEEAAKTTTQKDKERKTQKPPKKKKSKEKKK